MYGLNKYMIDINIETLAGTNFSLKVSPLESVQSVKAKIQRLEGIPISHQHLIWKTNELDDNNCLNDYQIPNGATIRMVLALRGGPINTRRMTTEDSLLRDVSDLMEIREDSNLWNNNDSAFSMNKHVTLLLFRDGDHLNLLRVIDRADATSPVSGAMSAASMYAPFDETDPETVAVNAIENSTGLETDMPKLVKLTKPIISRKKKPVNNENEKTREKMEAIRKKMSEKKSLKLMNKRRVSAKHQGTINEQIINKTDDSTNNSNTGESSNLASPSKSELKPSTTNVNNIRMKRYQIISEPKVLVATTNTTSTANEVLPNILKNNQSAEKLTNSAKQQVVPSRTSAGRKAKLTTIYTTTDRNGQVFIKRIHENFHELNDDEEDDDDCEEDDDDCDEEDDCEDETEEESNADSEEDEAGVVIGADGYEYDCETGEQEVGGVLIRDRKNYYDEEYFVDDEDDEDEEDEEEDIGDDEMDGDLDEDEDGNGSYYKNASTEQAEEYEQNEGDNYEDYEDQELLNKSELLLTNEDRQTNNSPNFNMDSNVESQTRGSTRNGTRNSDLLTMMMLMNLNSANGTTSSGGPVSSSLATTALPTIFTPFYSTDNENFVVPSTRSMNKRSKQTHNRRGKLNQQILVGVEQKQQLGEEKKVYNCQVESSILEKIEQIKLTEKKIMDERIEQKNRLRQQRKYRQKLKSDEVDASKEVDVVVMRRRKKQRDAICPSTSAGVNSNRSILLVQEEIERIKNKTKSLVAESVPSQDSSDLKTNVDHDNESAPVVVASHQAKNYHLNKNSEPALTTAPASRMPSSLQKRVSFILTNGTSEEGNIQMAKNEATTMTTTRSINTEPTEDSYDTAKRIFKTRQLSTSSLSKSSSLQAKVFNDNATKPVILTSYKSQKPPQKLESLTSSTDVFQSSTSAVKSEIQSLLTKRNSALSRRTGASTPTSTPNVTTVSTPTSQSLTNQFQLAKSYQNTSVSTSTIEPLARYSASNLGKLNRQISISANDIGPSSSKQLRLPPVNNNVNNGSAGSVIIGGSTNNLSTMGLSDGIAKKKIKNMSNYCHFCKRKTGLASSYTCRCGNNYCTQHRNAECHNCTYDYKTEGRKLIEHANPLVAAQKLPKI